MKKGTLRIIIAILSICFILSGCSSVGNKSSQKEDAPASAGVKSITIAASFYPIYIMTLNIVKDIPNVKVVDIVKPIQGCLHDYSLTTEDMKNLEGAKYFVVNGAGMESFINKVVNQMPDLEIIKSDKDILLIKGEGDEGDNPHIWVSIPNAILQVKNIGNQLASLDKKNASKYIENTNNYVKKLESLKEKMHNALDGLKNRDIVTFHEAFPYFAKEFNLNIAGVIEREPGSEPSAKELKGIIEKVKELKVKALFAEPQYSAKAAETIASETGAKVYTLDPAVTGPMEADAYIKIMESNLKTLLQALN